MIPHKLRLQNFLSYRDGLEPLDFTSMHLVCLVGENGHGKSALLDAITWALWGRARTNSDDELMHAGSTEMQVEFEFGLSGQRYNVIRKRLAGGRSRKSELELAVWDAANTAWQPLTEPSLRLTQDRITGILRMDYDTFVHSAFLKQGEADAFTRKTPGERKGILAAILNLKQYDDYAEAAKLRSKQAEAEALALDREVQRMDQEIAQRPLYEEQLRTAILAETQAKLELTEAERQETAARLEIQTLVGKQSEREDLARRLAQALANHGETESQLKAAQTRLQSVDALLVEREAIAEGYAALQAARQEEALWSERLRARRPLEQRFQQYQRSLLEAKGQLEGELRLARREWEDAQRRAQGLAGLERDLVQVAEDISGLEGVQARSLEMRERGALLAADRGRLEQEKSRIQSEGDTLKERLEVLRTGEASECPVCKQPLGATGRQHLEQEYDQQLAALRDQFRETSEQIKQIGANIQAIQADMLALDRELRRLQPLQHRQAELEAGLKEARAAAEVLSSRQTLVATLTLQLEQVDFAHEVRAQMAVLTVEMARLDYDEVAHQRAQATVSDLAGLERKNHDLETALQQVDDLRQQVYSASARWQREEDSLAADREKLRQLDQEVAGLPALQTQVRTMQRKADDLRRQWEDATGRMAAAQQRLLSCEALVATRLHKLRELGQIREQASRYRHLQEAFGPSGVQAMIIEAALPELESEANRLLLRLSDGRMNVRLATQRDLKTGGVRETLDIILSDELGSRPYEMFSGGEAFRADLALRIALSRLLARRAGAALQTLFLDEGFGTQDAHGRENLVEAIHMIKDEFALVLVITHIDELKEQFPVRIQVVKEDGRGSRYWVM